MPAAADFFEVTVLGKAGTVHPYVVFADALTGGDTRAAATAAPRYA